MSALPPVVGVDSQALAFLPALHAQVGLTSFPARIVAVDDLADEDTGQRYNGCYSPASDEITLDRALFVAPPKRLQDVYLHEMVHKVCRDYGLDSTPDAANHHEIFGVLLATVYRRAGSLAPLGVYDFGDRHMFINGQPFAHRSLDDEYNQPPDARELTRRFEYIVKRSESLAQTALSIEQIAQHLAKTDFMKLCQPPKEPRKPLSVEFLALGLGLLGCVAGASATAAVLLR